jgi:hypothetical protein
VQSELAFYEGLFNNFISFQGWNQNAVSVGDQIGLAVISLELGIFTFMVGKTIATGGANFGFIVEIVFKILAMTTLLACLAYTQNIGTVVATYPCQIAQEVVGQNGTSGAFQNAPGTVNDCSTIAQPFGMFQEGWAVWNDVLAIQLPDGNGGWFNWFSNKVSDFTTKAIMYSVAAGGMLALWILAIINLVCLAIFKASIFICAIFLPLWLFQFFAHMGKNVLTYLFTSAELLFGYYLGCFIGIALINTVVGHLATLAQPAASGSIIGIASLGIWGVIAPVFVLFCVVGLVVLIMWLVARVARGTPFSPQAMANAAMRVGGGVAVGVATAGVATAGMGLAAGKAGAKFLGSNLARNLSKPGGARERAGSFLAKLRDRVGPSSPKDASGSTTSSSSARDATASSARRQPTREPQAKPRTSQAQPTAQRMQEHYQSQQAPSAAARDAEDTPKQPTEQREASDTSAASEIPRQAVDDAGFAVFERDDRGATPQERPPVEGKRPDSSTSAPPSEPSQATSKSRAPESGDASASVTRGPSAAGDQKEGAPRRPVELMGPVPTFRLRPESKRPGGAAPAQRPVEHDNTSRQSPFQRAVSRVTQSTPYRMAKHVATRFSEGFGTGYRATADAQREWNEGAGLYDVPAQRFFKSARPSPPASVAQMNAVARSLHEIAYQNRANNEMLLRDNMQMRPSASSRDAHAVPPQVPRDARTTSADRGPAATARRWSMRDPARTPAPKARPKPTWVSDHERELRGEDKPTE